MNKMDYIKASVIGNFMTLNSHNAYFVCRCSIGDIIYICSIISEYKKTNKKNKVIFIIAPQHRGIVGLYKKYVDGVIVVNREILLLLDDYIKSGHKVFSNNITVIGVNYARSSKLKEIYTNTYVGLMYLYKKEILHMKEIHSFERPNLIRLNNLQIRKIIEKYEIVKGKSVILAPYAQTLPNLPKQFWNILAQQLQELGYVVYTNIKASGEESIIYHTKEFCVPLEYVPTIVKYAGKAIVNRSGLADLLAVSGCDLSIIYYLDGRMNENYIRNWSLKDVPIGYNYHEHFYMRIDNERTINEFVTEILRIGGYKNE